MREPVDEAFRAEDARRTAYEQMCPVCDVCKQHITWTDHFYDLDGFYLCDDYNCIRTYLDNFKMSIQNFIDGRRE